MFKIFYYLCTYVWRRGQAGSRKSSLNQSSECVYVLHMYATCMLRFYIGLAWRLA